MDKRKRIGLIFSYDENWIGGSYYILNLIRALNTLEDTKKPALVILSFNINDYKIILSEGYPYVSFFNLNFHYSLAERIINKITRFLFKKNIIEKRPNGREIDVLFPARDTDYFDLINADKKLYWIPDFQEHYFSNFFSKIDIEVRKRHQELLASQSSHVVFSSQDALSDFAKFYPQYNSKLHIVSFAVTHPDYKRLDVGSLRTKYSLPVKYFFAPNQFAQHKNQIIILKALNTLKKSQINAFVVFSGKEYDSRNPDYFRKLKEYVSENQLDEYAKFIGFIDREEQLRLMENASAILQPSLFEGWSTVVEDAKAMNQFMVLSALSVHKEQAQNNAVFFAETDEDDLANKMLEVLKCPPEKHHLSYSENVSEFAEKFMNVIENNF